MDDLVLNGMARELRSELVARELDPKDPPITSNPPAAAAFAEYQRRGGSIQQDADMFIELLIERVAA